MRLLAGVLWMSNLEFVHDEADRNEETYVVCFWRGGRVRRGVKRG